MNECSIKPELITKEMMEQFVAYQQSRSVGEGAKSIYTSVSRKLFAMQ